jgi:hypothetical protein
MVRGSTLSVSSVRSRRGTKQKACRYGRRRLPPVRLQYQKPDGMILCQLRVKRVCIYGYGFDSVIVNSAWSLRFLVGHDKINLQ